MAAGVLVFGFFVGAALLGVAAIAGLIAWARLRWGKPVIPRRAAAACAHGRDHHRRRIRRDSARTALTTAAQAFFASHAAT
jgi:hypothetical protein